MKGNFNYLVWIFAAGLLGYFISAIFASYFRLPRNLFLIPYFGMTSAFLYGYMRWSQVSVTNMVLHNWYWGLLGGVLLGLFNIRNIMMQPASQHTEGLNLVFDLIWSGVAYGLIDALLLSVLPVHATWMAFSTTSLTRTFAGKLIIGGVAFLASLLVTGAYHLGYPEYQGTGLVGPVIGNGAMSIGYLVTSNPLSSIFSHITMHIAGVLHGAATVTQLPPHYLP
jgi:hypothetical protein